MSRPTLIMPAARISGVGQYAPKRTLTNHDLEKLVETTDAWIVERTGIRERRIAAEGETTTDLAANAAREALRASHTAEKDVDLILVATSTPDMAFPSTACMVQARLGAGRAAAFDLLAACSGFVYALSIADQYIRTGVYRKVLVIGSEVMSRIVNWKDRNTCILFGDGAGAVVVEAAGDDGGKILSTHLHSDGRESDLIKVVTPDAKSQSGAGTAASGSRIEMKGSETFKVAVRAMEEASREALEFNRLTTSDVDWIIPHQANRRIIKAVAERLDVSLDKVYMNLEYYGNTSAASIPMALEEAVRTGKIKKGNLVLFIAFGAGLTWSSALVRW